MSALLQPLEQLANRWFAEAIRHEAAASELYALLGDPLEEEDPSNREERLLHIESARVYRNVAGQLRELLK